MSYEDNVLISLRRQYSKDETVAAMSKKLSLLELENGELKSEVDYLEHEVKKLIDSKELDIEAKIRVKKEELYKQKVKENKEAQKTIKELRDLRNRLFSKIITLENQVEGFKIYRFQVSSINGQWFQMIVAKNEMDAANKIEKSFGDSVKYELLDECEII